MLENNPSSSLSIQQDVAYMHLNDMCPSIIADGMALYDWGQQNDFIITWGERCCMENCTKERVRVRITMFVQEWRSNTVNSFNIKLLTLFFKKKYSFPGKDRTSSISLCGHEQRPTCISTQLLDYYYYYLWGQEGDRKIRALRIITMF